MTLTLRARLAVLSTAVFGLLVAGVSVTTYRILAGRLDSDTTARLLELADGLHGYLRIDGDAALVAFDRDDGDQATFVHEATQYYRVYDQRDGRLLAESSGMAPLGLQLTPAEVRSLLARPGPVDVETQHGRFRFASSAGTTPNGRSYLLQVGVTLAGVDAVLARYRSLLVWRLPAILAVAVLAFWWLARFALLPLARVADAAELIDVNTLETRVPVRGVRDELDRVAESFNHTLARLSKAVCEMRQFSSALVHELRTPLAVLRGQIELSLLSTGPRDPQRDRFASQLEEIDRLTRLIDRVLTLARAESGQVQLNFAPVDLGALAVSLVGQLQPLAEARAIDLRCEVAPAVVVAGDAGWLERMLLNLLDNALKYTGPHGRVEVLVSRAQDTARLDVRDTGVGLSPEDARRVFEKFFRADPARSSESEGAGLGLSLVEWIATRHHGAVTVSSRLGEGSTFAVTLPLGRD